jgi:crotonyl-CoA carboxylase/reductase
MKDIYPLAEMPPLGDVPKRMHAQVIRQERFGQPDAAFRGEEIDVPADLAPDEVLVWVMAAGINYNNVWAGLGTPIDVIKSREKDANYQPFHIGGSDASGIIWKVGSAVTDVKVGDHVVIHCGSWKADCPSVKAGVDPMFSPTFRIWGYETNWGSFAQFTRVQAHQCLPKAPHLTWEAAAAYMLVGATAYRMLMGWPPNIVQPGDVVLVWGGAGGLGSQAIQIVRERGGIPVAVISSDDKVEFCERLGAKGCINRKHFSHWGMMPHWEDEAGYAEWSKGCRAFGKAIWEVLGERKSPRLVFEHPGESTVPTSIFVCDTGGMVVVCAGTTGYNATVDLRYLWMRQKRFQGSHFANDDNARAYNELVVAGKIDPCLSETYGFDQIGHAHQLMHDNRHPHGNMACLVNAPKTGLTDVPR